MHGRDSTGHAGLDQAEDRFTATAAATGAPTSFEDVVGLAAGTGVTAPSAARAGGEAAGTFNLSIGGNRNRDREWEEWQEWKAGQDNAIGFKTLQIRARRCKCGVCPSCCSSVAWKESQRVKAVIEKWKFPQMWTFTINPRAYPDRRAILEWIKEKKCIATMVQHLARKKLVTSREYYAVMEFQDGSRNAHGVGTEEVHFHVLLDTPGFLDWAMMWSLWESKAPPWRATGNTCDKHNPAMGFVRFDKVYQGDGLATYLAKGVAGYLSKGPKNLPQWFREYIDDGHNMRLKYASRNFFKEFAKRREPLTPERRAEVKRKRENPTPDEVRALAEWRANRRTVSQRIEQCKHDADGYIIVDGKPRWIDRAAWDWETILKLLEKGMSEENVEACRKLGRVQVTSDEFIRLVGVYAWLRLVELNEGVGVGVSKLEDSLPMLAEDKLKRREMREIEYERVVKNGDTML